MLPCSEGPRVVGNNRVGMSWSLRSETPPLQHEDSPSDEGDTTWLEISSPHTHTHAGDKVMDLTTSNSVCVDSLLIGGILFLHLDTKYIYN